jgi:predicted ATPase
VSALTNIDHVECDKLCESLAVLSVDGVGGVGKTTLLLIVAHDARVRRKFDYILFLALGKDATEAKVVSDVTNRAEASGGGALTAKIRAVPLARSRCNKL